MSNTLLYILIALIAGVILPTQAGINNKLAMTLDSPPLAALISFAVGTVALFIYTLFSGISITNLSAMSSAPLLEWTGGLMGAFFVASTIILLPKLGVALTFSLVLAGQMVTTLVIDHYGLLGVPIKEVNLPRVFGIILLIAGVVIVRKY